MKSTNCITLVLIFLVGCNSEGSYSEGSYSESEANPTLIEIIIAPTIVSLLEGRTQQLVAIARYDNGSEKDVSNSVAWSVVGDPTVADISASGLLTGNTKGYIELSATKEGIINTVKTTIYDSLAGEFIDIFDVGDGKLFTNSPSIAYLDSIGGSVTSSTHSESPPMGPAGNFYRFTWNNANELCVTYNSKNIGGRTNWRLADKDELKTELFDISGNMFPSRGWATGYVYWSKTPNGMQHDALGLRDGTTSTFPDGTTVYATCVSEP